MTAPTQASAETEFRLLYEALRGYHTGLHDYGFKSLALMVAGIGWLMGSQSTRDFLAAHALARNGLIFFLAFAVLAYAVMSHRIYRLSQSALANLDALAYARRETYEHYAVKKFEPVYYTLVHALIAAALIAIVLLTPGKS